MMKTRALATMMNKTLAVFTLLIPSALIGTTIDHFCSLANRLAAEQLIFTDLAPAGKDCAAKKRLRLSI